MIRVLDLILWLSHLCQLLFTNKVANNCDALRNLVPFEQLSIKIPQISPELPHSPVIVIFWFFQDVVLQKIQTMNYQYQQLATAWRVSKYGVFSGRYFPVFGLNTEIYGAPYSVRIQESTDQKKLRIWTLFSQCVVFRLLHSYNRITDSFCKINHDGQSFQAFT